MAKDHPIEDQEPPTDGGSAAPGAPAPAQAPAPSGAPPPAAEEVLRATASENDAAELVRLKRERDEAIEARKRVEMDNAQLQDTVRRITSPEPVPIDHAPAAKGGRTPGWLDAYRTPEELGWSGLRHGNAFNTSGRSRSAAGSGGSGSWSGCAPSSGAGRSWTRSWSTRS